MFPRLLTGINKCGVHEHDGKIQVTKNFQNTRFSICQERVFIYNSLNPRLSHFLLCKDKVKNFTIELSGEIQFFMRSRDKYDPIQVSYRIAISNPGRRLKESINLSWLPLGTFFSVATVNSPALKSPKTINTFTKQ